MLLVNRGRIFVNSRLKAISYLFSALCSLLSAALLTLNFRH